MVDRRTAAPSVVRQLDSALASLAAESAGSTISRIAPTATRLGSFLERSGVTSLTQVTPEVAGAFVISRLSSGRAPSVATMHDRRSTLRLLFRAARRGELMEHDPTLDLVLPARAVRWARPLTDQEVERARNVALWSLSSRRIAAAWALAEATGRGAELANVSARDVDLAAERVWLSGGARTEARWGTLSDWGVRVLRGRLSEVGADHQLVYNGTNKSAGQVATCHAISTVLVRAGLAGGRDVRPMSVAGWAGRRVFTATGDLAAVAGALGVRSLDQASRLIGHDWKR